MVRTGFHSTLFPIATLGRKSSTTRRLRCTLCVVYYYIESRLSSHSPCTSCPCPNLFARVLPLKLLVVLTKRRPPRLADPFCTLSRSRTVVILGPIWKSFRGLTILEKSGTNRRYHDATPRYCWSCLTVEGCSSSAMTATQLAFQT